MASQNIDQTFCKVRGCRYARFHTTIAHRCGDCNNYGHGQVECRNDMLKQTLFRFLEDTMPEHLNCNFPNCTYPWSHASSSHHCFRCGERGTHSGQNCIRTYNTEDRREGYINNSSTHTERYNRDNIASGGGSSLNGSATKVEEPLEEPIIEPSVEVEEVDIQNSLIYKQCPICREYSHIDMNMKLFTGKECVICMEDNKKVIFNTCKHANVCYKCVVLL